eukprot:scaffold48203_cov50-Prasinocladus_malaysianus.AAC.1
MQVRYVSERQNRTLELVRSIAPPPKKRRQGVRPFAHGEGNALNSLPKWRTVYVTIGLSDVVYRSPRFEGFPRVQRKINEVYSGCDDTHSGDIDDEEARKL